MYNSFITFDRSGKALETIRKQFNLDARACDEISELIGAFCEKNKTEHSDAIRYRLSAEECLLYWLKGGLEGATVEIQMGRHMMVPYIDIAVEGDTLNPYVENTEDFGTYTGSILVSLDLHPEYSYVGNKNHIRFSVKKKQRGQIATLLIVIAAAALVGFAGLAILPDGAREVLLTAVINPVYNTFFNILGCIAGPMIFLSVAWGVYGIGDAATFGRIGKNMMLSYIGISLVFSAAAVVCFPILGPGLSAAEKNGGQFASFAELILGIFPSTIVEPFLTGNTLQIIFMAIIIGIALLYLGRRTVSIARAIEEINVLVQFLMNIISKLVPYVIFLVVVNLIWSDDMEVLVSVWKLIAVMLAAFIITAAVFFAVTSFLQKVGPRILIRKDLPTFLVALTTASSAAAFESNIRTCEKRFGINGSLVKFGIPLGMVMHKPIASIYNLLLVFYFAKEYNVSCSVMWICIAVFISAIIAIATPPIPGGGAIAYALLFLQMGIPSDALAVALAIDLFTDFLITSFEMLVLPVSLINISAGLGMIDKDVLKDPAK